MGSPAISIASSFDPATQIDRRATGGGRNNTSFDNPQSMNVPSSANYSASNTTSSNKMNGMGYGYGQPGPHSHQGGSFNSHGHQYPPAMTSAGASNEHPLTIGDHRNDVARQRMQQPARSTGHLQEQPAMMKNMSDMQMQQQYFRQQQGYAPPQNGHMVPATNGHFTGYMERQTQRVRDGVGSAAQFNSGNPAQVGLGLAGNINPTGGAIQTFYGQSYQQRAPTHQVPHPPHGLPTTTNSPSVHHNSEVNMNTRAPGVNHGLSNVLAQHSQNGQVASYQPTPGGQDTQAMMSNANGMAGMGRSHSATPNGHSITTPKKSSESQNMRPTSSSKPRRAPDAFDLPEAESSFQHPGLSGLMGNAQPNPAPVSQPESFSQNGPKRKRQEEHVGVQMAGAGIGERNDGDRQMNPQKRQKQDAPGAPMTGQAGQQHGVPRPHMQGAVRNDGNVRQTPQNQSMQSSQGAPQQVASTHGLQVQHNPVTASGNMEIQTALDVGTAEHGYNAHVLRLLQFNRKAGQTPRETHLAFLNSLIGKQGRLTPDQLKCAEKYNRMLLEQSGAVLTNTPVANSQTSSRPTSNNENVARSHPNGLPQSAMSLSAQKEQHSLMQQQIRKGNNRGNVGAPMEQTGTSQRLSGQPPALQTSGSYNINMQSQYHPTLPITNGAAIPPVLQGSYIPNTTVSPIPGPGHKFGGPAVPQPTPNMIGPTATAQQYRNGDAGVPHQHVSVHSDRSMSAPRQVQSNGNGFSAVQTGAGYPPNPNNGRPSTAPSFAPVQGPKNPASSSAQFYPPQPASVSMQKSTSLPAPIQVPNNQAGGNISQSSVPHPASTPMQKSTSLPTNSSRPSVDPRASGMQPHHYQQVQGQNIHQRPQSSHDQQASANPYQPQMHDQPLQQAVNSAVTGNTSAPVQSSAPKTTSPHSNPGTGSDHSSSATNASPPSGSNGNVPDWRLKHGIWIDVANVNIVEVLAPVFHQPFTFPTERDGWSVMLDHIKNQHTLANGQNIILISEPQFMGGVIWPDKQAPPVPQHATPPPSVAQKPAPKPRNRGPSKKKPTPQAATTTSNTAMASTAVPSTVSSNPFVPVPAPSNPPLWPGDKWVDPALRNYDTSKSSKPVLQLDLKNVSPKTAMRNAGPVEKQIEPGFPTLFGQSSGSTAPAVSAQPGEQNTAGKDDGPSAEDGTSPVEESGDKSALLVELFGDDDDDEPAPEHQSQSSPSNANSPPPVPSTATHSGLQSSSPLSNQHAPRAISPGSPQPAVIDAQQGDQSFLDKAQPTREGLAPKSILVSNSPGPQQSENANQTSSEATSRHVHFEQPKPVEEDILTSDNAAEWRARHPIPQLPSITWKPPRRANEPSPVSSPVPSSEFDYDFCYDMNLGQYVTEDFVIKEQEKWLQDIFPDYPLLTRLDINSLDKPEYVYMPDPAELDGMEAFFCIDEPYWGPDDPHWRRGIPNYDDHGLDNVRAALDMLKYVEKWGEREYTTFQRPRFHN